MLVCMLESVLHAYTSFRENSMIPQNLNPFYTNVHLYSSAFPGSIYLLKINNRSTKTRCEICSKLKIKTPVQALVALLLNLNISPTLFLPLCLLLTLNM